MNFMLWTWSTTVAVCLSLGCGNVKHLDVDAATPSDSRTAMEVTLSQTNSSSVTSGVGCRTTTTNYTKENNFYRGFKLADYGVTGGFKVKKVTFGVFSAISGGIPVKTQPAELSIFAYSGAVGADTIDLSKLTKQGGAMIQVPDATAPTTIDVPIDAELPAGTDGLVVQFHVSDGTAAMHQLMLGANQQGERLPAYQLAPLCGQTNPVAFPAAGLSIYALVLSVTGDG